MAALTLNGRGAQQPVCCDEAVERLTPKIVHEIGHKSERRPTDIYGATKSTYCHHPLIGRGRTESLISVDMPLITGSS